MDGDFRGGPAGRPDGMTAGAPGAHASAPPAIGGAGRGLPAHDVRGLMRGGTQAVLTLDGTAYSLRITRAGKLILTK